MSTADPHVARRRELRLTKRRLQASVNRWRRKERELHVRCHAAAGEILAVDRELRALDKFGVEGRE